MSSNLAKRTAPLLENGDRMDRAEFHRRYLLTPEEFRAELLEGIVYMSSPVSACGHGFQTSAMIGWMHNYRARTRGVLLVDNSTLLLDDRNEPQPDVMMWIPRALGGQAELRQDKYVYGAPELIVEVAYSSRLRDMGPKREAYRRNGVREYIVWLVEEERFVLHHLRDGTYVEATLDESGLWRSEVFPGLWLDTKAMLRDDGARVIEVLEMGLAHPEHAEFVAKLANAATGAS
jgi:Uma2 family endonuclease